VSRYVRFVLRHRALVLAVCALVTFAAVAMLSQAVVASSVGKLFFGESPAFLRYLERVRQFGTDDVIILAIEDLDVLDPATLDRLEAATDAIRDNAEVERITSILSAQRVRVIDGTLTAKSYATEARAHPERKDALLADLIADELAGGLLISKDGRSTVMIVELYVDAGRPAEDGPALVAHFVDALIAAGFPAERIHRAGFTAIMSEMLVQTDYTFKTIFPAVVLVLLLVVWVMFRRLWPVAIAMGISLIAVLWTMGISVAIDREISIMHSITPIVILIVGFSDVIHLCSAYLLELSHGKGKDDAILASADDVGRACFYTSLTTFFGFVGMSFVPTPVFRALGIILGSGVAIALLLAVTVVPIIFSFMRQPKPWRVGATSRVQAALDRVLNAMSNAATRHPWTVIGAFVVAFGFSVYGLAHLEIDAAFTERLADDNQLVRDTDFFEEHFTPSNLMQVYVQATGPGVVEAVDDDEFGDLSMDDPDFEDFEDSGEPVAQTGKNALFEPSLFARLAQLQRQIEARDDVISVTSLIDLYERMHKELTAGQPEAGALPTTRRGLSEYALLFELGGGQNLDRLVDFDRRTAVLSLRLKNEAAREARVTGDAVHALAKETLGADAEVEPSGIVYLMGDWLDEVISGQRRGLIFTFTAIAIFMCIGLRSVRVGLWSMVPNALPLLMLGGILGLLWDKVDSDNLILAMLAIGIGVDDTVHFMMRYKIEAARTADRRLALQRTFDFAGRAIVMTTVVLGAGFAPMMLSDYVTTARLGSLLPLTLTLALVADLLLVPALVMVGPLSFPKGPQSPPAGPEPAR